jgi:mannitol-1-/sugar-/sorbitol-6-/2-deoxyglucose-6-phosphatase
VNAASTSPNGKNGTFQAVVFDLDGVLMDSEWMAFLVWREIAEKHGGQLPDSHYPHLIGMTAEETGEYVMQQAGVRFDLARTVAWIWREVTNRVATGAEPMPGSQQLLEELNERGLCLAIASNSPVAYIEKALQGLKLRRFFQQIAGADEVEQGKPAPDVYLLAAKKLGIAPQNCVAIEDSLVGSQAAKNAGMRVLAVPSRHDDPGKFEHCYRIYDSLAPLCADLETILSGK